MHLELAPPAELSRRLLEDEADAGLAPVAVLAAHGGLELVPGMAIGVRRRGALGQDRRRRSARADGRGRCSTLSSRTSVVLARILVARRCAAAASRAICSKPPDEIIAAGVGQDRRLV